MSSIQEMVLVFFAGFLAGAGFVVLAWTVVR